MTHHVITGMHRRYLFVYLVLLCLCAITYSNTLQNEFTSDDHALISENRLTQSFKYVPEIFKRALFGRHDNFYRPLSQLSLMVEYFFFQLNPLGYHIVNILSHVIICVLFFAIIHSLFDTFGGVKPRHLWREQKHRLSIPSTSSGSLEHIHSRSVFDLESKREVEGSRTESKGNPEQARHNVGRVEGVDNYALSLLSAAFYAVHPIHHTAINQCSHHGMLVALCMLFSLVCVIEFLRGDRRRLSLYYLSITFFIIALLIREEAMVVPLYLICVLLFLKGHSLKRLTYLALPFFIGSIGYFIVRLFVLSLKSSIWNEFTKSLTLFEYVSGYVHLLSIYFYSIIIPRDIVWMFTIAARWEYTVVPLISFALLCSVVVFMVAKHWKKGPQSFGLAWFFVGALPTILGISNRPFFGLSMETHWFYISSMGIFLLFSSFLLQLKKHINAKLWICLIMSILLFYVTKTRAYNSLWINPKVYNEYWLSKYPNDLSREILAKIYFTEGDYKKTESLLKEALFYNRIKKHSRVFISPSRNSRIYSGLGMVYTMQGKVAEAVSMFNAALKMDPSNANAYFNLAGIFLKRGMFNEAILNYEKAVAFDPYILVAHHNLAILYAQRGDNEKALQAYAKAIALDKNCFIKNTEQ